MEVEFEDLDGERERPGDRSVLSLLVLPGPAQQHSRLNTRQHAHWRVIHQALLGGRWEGPVPTRHRLCSFVDQERQASPPSK